MDTKTNIQDLLPFSEIYCRWWVVWRKWTHGTAVPEAAYPFHKSAREHRKKIGEQGIIRRASDGFPPSEINKDVEQTSIAK